MILVTLGTNEQPFDRLVGAAAQLDLDEPLLVQYGASREPHGLGEWVDFMPFDALADAMRRASVVVSHAGVGSIMLARRCGKRPLVVPRRRALGEAVDDHQLHLARRLDQLGVVSVVEDMSELAAAIVAARSCLPAHGAGAGGSTALHPPLIADVRGYLFQAIRAAR
jgi:UDP-N-acetylglucosamine transferase subunit ALG13